MPDPASTPSCKAQTEINSTEYSLQAIALVISSGALIGVLIMMIHGTDSVSLIAFSLATLLVAAPVALLLSLRLGTLEQRWPELKHSPSKHRSAQVVRMLSFIACLVILTGFVYNVFLSAAGESSVSMAKLLLDVAVVLAVAGGIFMYYWRDDHLAGR